LAEIRKLLISRTMCIGRGKELYMQCIARYLLENTIQEQYAAQMMQHLGYIYMSQASGQLTAIGSKGQPLLAPALDRLLSYYRHDFTMWKTCSTISDPCAPLLHYGLRGP